MPSLPLTHLAGTEPPATNGRRVLIPTDGPSASLHTGDPRTRSTQHLSTVRSQQGVTPKHQEGGAPTPPTMEPPGRLPKHTPMHRQLLPALPCTSPSGTASGAPKCRPQWGKRASGGGQGLVPSFSSAQKVLKSPTSPTRQENGKIKVMKTTSQQNDHGPNYLQEYTKLQ